MKLSVSQLKSVARCGRAFELERIEGFPSRPYAWTLRGTAVHNTIEMWEKNRREIDPLTFLEDHAWPEAVAVALAQWPEQAGWGKTPMVKTVAQDLKLRYRDAVQQVSRYVERALDEADLWSVHHSEVPFVLEPPDEHWIVRGKIDQVIRWSDGDVTIRDLKTGGDDSESNIQLGVYRLGLKESLGIDVTYGDYWYTKLDRASKPIDLTAYTPEYVYREFQTLYKIKTQGLYLANASIKGCFGCGVAKHCQESKV